MNPLIQCKPTILPLLIAGVLACFGLSPKVQAVSPPPDGCYPNFTTAEGCDALNFLTTGSGNTALGWRSLFFNTDASFNTGVGSGALALNNADSNTAVGAAALLLNTSGTENTAVGTDALVFNDIGSQNTATGAFALFNNTEGIQNTANGWQALRSNTTGSDNTATGSAALYANTTGDDNTATGFYALLINTTGFQNTANGLQALFSNTTGFNNTATGFFALYGNTGAEGNTAIGARALENSTGDFNTAIGYLAGLNITGIGNVCIGEGVVGDAGVDFTTWIRNVYDSVASGRAVYVNSDNKIGTLASSRRYKDEIRPMATASEAILLLRPVSFRYKKEVDPTRSLSFGLIAEEVAQVDPDLVTPDRAGKPETVRYEAVNAMLLNEFLKEHDKNEEQEATIARLQKQIEALAADLQKVSAQLELTRAPQVVATNP